MLQLERPVLSEERGARTELAHKESLDGVRGLAIALVLIGHGFDPLLPGAAAVGVALFFVLSGFLITSLLVTERERTGRISLRKFYARRALRLFPALYALLGVYGAWLLLFAGDSAARLGWHSVWTGGLYVSNWTQALQYPAAPYFGHTWSLATEEQFYVLWPGALIVMLALWRRRRSAVVATACLILATAVLRAVLHRVPSPIQENLYFSPFTWGDGLLVGCLLGLLYSWRSISDRINVTVPLVFALGFLGIATMSGAAEPLFYGGATVMALCNATVVLAAVYHPGAGRVLSLKPLARLGRISYGVYLWHLPVLAAILGLLPGVPRALSGAVAIASTIGVAAVSYRYLERPFLRLKDRFSAG